MVSTIPVGGYLHLHPFLDKLDLFFTSTGVAINVNGNLKAPGSNVKDEEKACNKDILDKADFEQAIELAG